jgi:sulfane dehydrogenase subunit SoxC
MTGSKDSNVSDSKERGSGEIDPKGIESASDSGATDSAEMGFANPNYRKLTRRAALGAAASAVVGVGMAKAVGSQNSSMGAAVQKIATKADSSTMAPVVPADPTKVPGAASAATSPRSPFVNPAQTPLGVISGSTFTPLQDLTGTVTPADLHFQRHHNGIALIDPRKYKLTVHGLVERPIVLSLSDLKRFPAVTRTYFIECAGNGRSAYRAPKPEMTPQVIDGQTGNSEWTGVPVATLLEEVGAKRDGKWVLAEGGDAALLSRSIPMEKMLDDALIVYAQNGEPLRPSNGYPARLLLPGYEGNMCIKWIRRLKVIRQPNMSRDETAKYTDPLPNGTARQFSFIMDPKSIITSPAYPEKLTGAGWWPIIGIAWSGRGKIARVEVSTDGGRSWYEAELLGNVLPKAHVRFQHMWKWDGRPGTIMSRAVDETGAVQPTLDVFKKSRGTGTDYHFNHIRTWLVAADGQVTFGG